MDPVSAEGKEYYKGDEVKVVATKYDANAQYNGLHGTVVSDGVIRDPHNKQISGGNYYYVRLDICHIAIRGDMLEPIKPASGASGASGAP